MTMGPRLRKFALTAHITSSVGWIGAVAGFLALAVAGVTSHDAQTVRGAHLGGGLLVLLVPMVLSVYKPRGMTRYGRRKQDTQRRKQQEQRRQLDEQRPVLVP